MKYMDWVIMWFTSVITIPNDAHRPQDMNGSGSSRKPPHTLSGPRAPRYMINEHLSGDVIIARTLTPPILLVCVCNTSGERLRALGKVTHRCPLEDGRRVWGAHGRD